MKYSHFIRIIALSFKHKSREFQLACFAHGFSHFKQHKCERKQSACITVLFEQKISIEIAKLQFTCLLVFPARQLFFCSVGRATGMKIYGFKKKTLIGGFKHLKSGNHDNESLWNLVPMQDAELNCINCFQVK